MKGCSSYEPVAVDQCEHVVKHATEVLGKLSPSNNDLLKSCKAATDDKRGCIMTAENLKEITKCE